MDDIKMTLTGLTRYSGRSGQLSFILHRLTGLGTLLFLSLHILDTATVYFAPSLYQHAIDLYRSSLFMVGEIVLVFCVIYHGVNGLRIAYLRLVGAEMVEFGHHTKDNGLDSGGFYCFMAAGRHRHGTQRAGVQFRTLRRRKRGNNRS